eukprot:364924-Chlamydomonas_euryale.AAC.8
MRCPVPAAVVMQRPAATCASTGAPDISSARSAAYRCTRAGVHAASARGLPTERPPSCSFSRTGTRAMTSPDHGLPTERTPSFACA